MRAPCFLLAFLLGPSRAQFLQHHAHAHHFDNIASRANKAKCFDATSWKAEFKKKQQWRKYSQGDQDSTVTSLFADENLGTTSKECVEFGFHDKDVLENPARPPTGQFRDPRKGEVPCCGANTQYLVAELGWKRHAFDATEEGVGQKLQYVTPMNVVDLFKKAGVSKAVDYVSIDIDSCDIWVFLALTDVYRPTVVSIEYNANYALNESKTNKCIDPKSRSFFHAASFGHGFFGWSGSLRALVKAGRRRGYELVWVDPFLDAWFIRKDRLCPGSVPPINDFADFVGKPFQNQDVSDEVKEHWIIEFH